MGIKFFVLLGSLEGALYLGGSGVSCALNLFLNGVQELVKPPPHKDTGHRENKHTAPVVIIFRHFTLLRAVEELIIL